MIPAAGEKFMDDPDKEIIEETLNRKPSPYRDLFICVGDQTDAIIDWSVRQLFAYAEAHYDAAKFLAEEFCKSHLPHFRAIPILESDLIHAQAMFRLIHRASKHSTRPDQTRLDCTEAAKQE